MKEGKEGKWEVRRGKVIYEREVKKVGQFLIFTFSFRLEARTTAPAAVVPVAPELELASATIAARRFASAD